MSADIKMTNSNNGPLIGAFVLETLTTGMYRNPLDALREYVQNAFDSIRAAEREGIIRQGAGRINLFISEKENSIRFIDNGTGISVSDISAKLVNIGMSEKNLQTDAGFRGIGRLAGIAYCKKLVFKTQGYAEDEISTITFDAQALKEVMSPIKRGEVAELANVIKDHVTFEKEKSRKKSHFLEVTMRDINSRGSQFLNARDVRNYLEQVAPLPIDTQSFPFSKDFYDWVNNTGVSLPEVNIIIHDNNTPYELYKPYKKMTYSTSQGKHKVHIRSLKFLPEDATVDSPFWLWYAETNCPGIIGKDSVAGLRLRKSNISIGLSERMTDIFRLASESYARFNRYFIGEVHIQHDSVIPNGHRDDFEETPEWLEIREQLLLFAKERSREAYALSEGRNADIEKLLTTANKQLDEVKKKQKVGLASKTEQVKLEESLEKSIGKLEAAEKAERPSDDIQRLGNMRKKLQRAQETISNETSFTVQNLKSSLDKKQRKIISEIIAILYDILDEANFEIARNAILKKYQISEKEQNL